MLHNSPATAFLTLTEFNPALCELCFSFYFEQLLILNTPTVQFQSWQNLFFFSFRAVELITQSNPRIPPNTRFLVEYENSGAGGCCVFRHMVGFGLMDEEADSDASGVEMDNFLFPPGLVQQAFCAPAYYFCMF